MDNGNLLCNNLFFFPFSFLPKRHTVYPIKDAHISEESIVFLKKRFLKKDYILVFPSVSLFQLFRREAPQSGTRHIKPALLSDVHCENVSLVNSCHEGKLFR